MIRSCLKVADIGNSQIYKTLEYAIQILAYPQITNNLPA